MLKGDERILGDSDFVENVLNPTTTLNNFSSTYCGITREVILYAGPPKLSVVVGLNDTKLIDANLRGANLRGGKLRNANLTGADLKGAKYDSNTIWPSGFDVTNSRAILIHA